MYNTNPDITVNNPRGGVWHMPGLMSKKYEEMGGRVQYFGKPHKVSRRGRHDFMSKALQKSHAFSRCTTYFKERYLTSFRSKSGFAYNRYVAIKPRREPVSLQRHGL